MNEKAWPGYRIDSIQVTRYSVRAVYFPQRPSEWKERAGRRFDHGTKGAKALLRAMNMDEQTQEQGLGSRVRQIEDALNSLYRHWKWGQEQLKKRWDRLVKGTGEAVATCKRLKRQTEVVQRAIDRVAGSKNPDEVDDAITMTDLLDGLKDRLADADVERYDWQRSLLEFTQEHPEIAE